jgi:UrcA family protein
MELQMATGRTGLCRLLLAAAACCSAVEFAQAAPAGAPGEQIIVQDAPYTVRQQVTERGNMSKMEVRQTSVSTGVTYSDLDLSKDSDVAILKDRARQAARDVCRQADRRAISPFDRPLWPAPDCVSSAKQQAMADVNRIVANARVARTVAAN